MADVRVSFKRTATGWNAIGDCPECGTTHSASGRTKAAAIAGLERQFEACCPNH